MLDGIDATGKTSTVNRMTKAQLLRTVSPLPFRIYYARRWL